jgi:hypothetical protein
MNLSGDSKRCWELHRDPPIYASCHFGFHHQPEAKVVQGIDRLAPPDLT